MGSMASPILPQYLVAQVRKVMPEDGIIALDNGIYKIWFARNYKAYRPNTILLDNALATMGAGLPSAMGANWFIRPQGDGYLWGWGVYDEFTGVGDGSEVEAGFGCCYFKGQCLWDD